MSLRLYEELGGNLRGLLPKREPLYAVGETDISHHVKGLTTILVALNEKEIIHTEVCVVTSIGPGIEILIGDPALRSMTQTFKKNLHICYKQPQATAFIGNLQLGTIRHTIVESDCVIDCHELEKGKFTWVFRWIWKNGVPPKNLEAPAIYWKKFDRQSVESAVQDWAKGVMEPCDTPLFAIPINPVPQDKVDHPLRITGDFKAFNKTIVAESTEDTNEVCSEALMAARRHKDGTILDLSKAYQAVLLHPELRKYNAFMIQGKYYQSTRMLFGIAVGQKVLYKILNFILPPDCVIYRDDILVPNSLDVKKVVSMLQLHGFTVKENSWCFEDLHRQPSLTKMYLGLCLRSINNTVYWSRPDNISASPVETCADLAARLGAAAASHLPCVGAVRAEVAILRSLIGKYVGSNYSLWRSQCPQDLASLWNDIAETLQERRWRPWYIPKFDTFHLYTDASSILLGGVIRGSHGKDIHDDILDFTRRSSQFHINLRELDAVIYGLQLLETVAPVNVDVLLYVDSKSCVCWTETAQRGWITRTKAQNKTLIKNRVDIIREILRVKNWRLKVNWLPSQQNPADKMTRVRSAFRLALKEQEDKDEDEREMSPQAPVIIAPNFEQPIEKRVEDLHRSHFHPGKEVLKQYISQLGWSVDNSLIDDVYARCVLCLRKRPAVPYINLKQTSPIPVRNWEWIQIDTLTVKAETKVMIAIDERTRFIEVQIVHGAPTARDTITLLTMLFHRYQLNEWHLRLDRGKEFYNSQVATWVTEHGGTCHYSTVRRPTACGMVERVNRSLLNIMRIVRSMFPENTLKQIIDKSVQEYWTRPHKGLQGISPRQALYECQPISETDLDDTSSIVISDTSDSEDDDDDGGPLPETPAENKQPRENTAPFWKEGQRVLIHEPTDDKLQLHWSPGTVVQNAGQNQAVKVKPDATEQGRQRAVTTVNQRWIASIPIPQSEGTAPEGSVHATADAGIEQPETTHAQERERTHAAGTAESPRRSSRRNKPSKYLQEPYM